jgi:tetratricopeptide (TPR) repeat protein
MPESMDTLAALVVDQESVTGFPGATAALEAARAATTSDRRSAEAQATLGQVYVAQGKDQEPMDAYKESLALNPRAASVMFELARLSAVLGGSAGALKYAREAVEADPDRPLPRLMLADMLIKAREFENAETQVRWLEQRFPNSAPVFLKRAGLQLARRDTVGAAAMFTKALTAAPDNLEALAGLTAIDVAAGRLPAARTRIDARLKAAPDDQGVLLLSGSMELQQGNYPVAEANMRKLIELAPTNLEAYRMLGQALTKQGRLDQAKTEFENIVRRNPRSVGARTAIGVILTLQKRDGEARRQYEQTLQIDPRAPIAANNLAWIYAENGEQLDIALQLAQNAQVQVPRRADISDTLGWVYYKKGLYEMAVPRFQDSVKMEPSNPYYRYHLGLALMKTARGFELGRRQVQQALQLNPNFDGAVDARRLMGARTPADMP